MIHTLSKLEADGHIGLLEAEAAMNAHVAGTEDHTIGYELELLPSAAAETPRVVEEGVGESENAARRALEPYDYSVGEDGEFELSSPPSKHPLALAVATSGIVHAGWLPEAPRGVVTSHVSIGSSAELCRHHNQKNTDRLINLLRGVELVGGTTPGRLKAPVRIGRDPDLIPPSPHAEYSWNQRGVAGVMVIDKVSKFNSHWHGGNARVEFRTIRYQSPSQFGETLANLYFLTRGLLSPEGTPPSDIYKCFESWFQNYRQEHGLPDIAKMRSKTEDKFFKLHKTLGEYILPYVNHLGQGVDESLNAQVSLTVAQLAEEFGMGVSSATKS